LHYGLLAPAGTPAPIIARLNAALRALAQSAEVKQRIVAEGGDPLTSTPEDYAKDIDREETKWGTLGRKLNLKVERSARDSSNACRPVRPRPRFRGGELQRGPRLLDSAIHRGHGVNSSARSFQLGLSCSISCNFHALFHFFSCRSRCNADSRVSCCSNQTSILTPCF